MPICSSALRPLPGANVTAQDLSSLDILRIYRLHHLPQNERLQAIAKLKWTSAQRAVLALATRHNGARIKGEVDGWKWNAVAKNILQNTEMQREPCRKLQLMTVLMDGFRANLNSMMVQIFEKDAPPLCTFTISLCVWFFCAWVLWPPQRWTEHSTRLINVEGS